MEMPRTKVLALVLAGGEGGRLDVLTERRAKPAMPYAGVYRLIDFPLSNCHHSGLSDVWIIQQYLPHSLSDHLSNGRPWDLDRTHGGLRILQPHLGADESGWYKGNADAIYRNSDPIDEFDPELILVLSADHLYKLDYAKVIARHVELGAEVTMVTAQVPIEQAVRFGTVQTDEEDRVFEFAYKPDEPETDVVTTEIFVYEARVLLETLSELADEGEDGDGALEDFGHELLPRIVERGRAYAYRLDGYWKDVGTIESYWEAHMDLLGLEPTFDLDDPSWPILTPSPQRPPARIAAGSQVEDSLVSPGCIVRGDVARSVLAPGVLVEEGAKVRDSVVLQDAVVAAGATVDCAILDAEAHVGKGAEVGAPGAAKPKSCSSEAIAVAGRRARIRAGARVSPGARLEPR